jgi:hypothetical protein
MEIYITNYAKNWINKPLLEVYTNSNFNFCNKSKTLTINDCLFVYVFSKIPFMRNIPNNKMWFKSDIYHTIKN